MEPAHQEPTQETQLTFPKRPKVSERFKGRNIKLVSNHFTISLGTDFIYLYDVKILDVENNEEIPHDARKLRQDVMRQKEASKKIKELFGTNYWARGQILWSIKNQPILKTIESEHEEKKYVIVLKKVKDISMKPETFHDNKLISPVLQYVNVLIKRYFNEQKFEEWGKNAKFYNPEKHYKIDKFYIEIYKGYKTACGIYQNYVPKILIDFASRIVLSDTALYYIDNAKSTEDARKFFQGRSVIATYGNYAMRRIDDIDVTQNPTKTFDANGKMMTYVDYYKQKYNVTITKLKQPLLLSIDRRTRKRLYFVPELVQPTGLTDEMKSDFNLMKEVAQYTRLEPNQRMEEIKSLETPLTEFLWKEYKIKMNTQSFVDGHVLNAPKLTIGNGDFVPDRGNYQLRDPIFRPANFSKWLFVYSEACQQDANNFLETLEKCSSAYAIKVGKPVKWSIKDKSAESLKDAIRSKLAPDTQIVVCMYPPGAKKHWYKALKDVCFKEKGIPCQAVVSASLKKNSMSVCSKILLQMNAKIGYELWITEKPAGLPERTMIIGADVYHKTEIGQEKKSCIGFCASLNPQFNRFFSKVSFQNKVGEEIMSNIGRLVKEAVLKYFAFNGKKFLPECIIFYRDGVAENQLQSVLNFETKAILDQLKTIDPNYDFKFAEVVVTKRIDDRIFTTEGTTAPRGGRGGNEPKGLFNPPTGTLVANTIVSNNFDFILVSQNVTQGTCTPTHYNVIYDTTGLSQDVFWQLSYSQCYNYYNWNGGVRVPAPVQYAHKLAYLVGQTVQGDPDKKLDETLYYL